MTDREWFESIYKQYYSKIKKTAYYIKLKKFGVRDIFWAEDITQSVFCKLCEGIKEKDLRNHPNIEAWLILTMRQTIGSDLQKAYHRCEVQLDAADGLYTDFDSMDCACLTNDFFPPGLKQEDRCILYLYCVEEYSHEELAEYLGCSNEASRMRLSRARERCKNLKKFEQDDGKRQHSTNTVNYTDKRGEQNV